MTRLPTGDSKKSLDAVQSLSFFTLQIKNPNPPSSVSIHLGLILELLSCLHPGFLGKISLLRNSLIMSAIRTQNPPNIDMDKGVCMCICINLLQLQATNDIHYRSGRPPTSNV